MILLLASSSRVQGPKSGLKSLSLGSRRSNRTTSRTLKSSSVTAAWGVDFSSTAFTFSTTWAAFFEHPTAMASEQSKRARKIRVATGSPVREYLDRGILILPFHRVGLYWVGLEVFARVRAGN